METPYPGLPESRIAYIREVPLAALPDAIRAQLNGARQVYGVHTEAGACIALARDRRRAFVLARQSDLEPVSAH